MFFEDLAEAGEVECLVVLNEDETEVELAECQLDVVHLAHFRSLRFVVGVNVLEEVVATLSSIAQSGHLSIIRSYGSSKQFKNHPRFKRNTDNSTGLTEILTSKPGATRGGGRERERVP